MTGCVKKSHIGELLKNCLFNDVSQLVFSLNASGIVTEGNRVTVNSLKYDRWEVVCSTNRKIPPWNKIVCPQHMLWCPHSKFNNGLFTIFAHKS